MARIATPKFVVSDGGSGFRKAMKKSGKQPDFNDVSSMHFAR